MNYPFVFHALVLTDHVLDTIGFSEYWAGSGDFGDRRLNLGAEPGDPFLIANKEYPAYFIYIVDESVDPTGGYCSGPPMYEAEHVTNKDFEPMYFIHDMYEDILRRRKPKELERFLSILKRDGVNMYPYIESYLKYKTTTNAEIPHQQKEKTQTPTF